MSLEKKRRERAWYNLRVTVNDFEFSGLKLISICMRLIPTLHILYTKSQLILTPHKASTTGMSLASGSLKEEALTVAQALTLTLTSHPAQ